MNYFYFAKSIPPEVHCTPTMSTNDISDLIQQVSKSLIGTENLTLVHLPQHMPTLGESATSGRQVL